jgi:hypothetical protein
MLRSLAITAALMGALSTAHADVWRYVDSEGRVQYSDRWVPGSELVKTTRNSPGRPSPAPDPSALATSRSIDEQQQQRAAEQTVQQDLAKVKAERCKKLKEEYEQAIQARRIYRTLPNGEREYISDAEADAYRVELLNRRKEACGS